MKTYLCWRFAWPQFFSHFHWIASTCSSSIVVYPNFTVNSNDYFLSEAGLFLIKLA